MEFTQANENHPVFALGKRTRLGTWSKASSRVMRTPVEGSSTAGGATLLEAVFLMVRLGFATPGARTWRKER